MGNNDIDKNRKGRANAPELPVNTEGGSEGLLNPAKAGRARQEAKHRGDVVSAQKSKPLEKRSIEEFAQKPGHMTYDAKNDTRNTDKHPNENKPKLNQRHHDGKKVEGE